MASPYATPGDDTFVGLFMLEQSGNWWLPPGFTLSPNGTVPIDATDPLGRICWIYAIPGYQPSPEQVDSVLDVIQRELGPVPDEGLSPEVYRFFGADQPSSIGLVNKAILSPVDAVARLFHLASYGIDAAIVGGTEAAAQHGWMDRTSAGQLRRDLMLLTVVLAAETSRASDMPTAGLRTAVSRAAALSRASASVLPPIVLRAEQVTGLPFGRIFRVVDVLQSDPVIAGPVTGARTTTTWLMRVQAGKQWELEQQARYNLTQIYVVKDTGKGYRVLDAIEPKDASFGAGPVSQKFTQLADVKQESAISALHQAYKYYRPGLTIADVPSTPLRLRGTTLTGQLWLEVPVQTKPVPLAVLAAAQKWSIKIRDTSGKVY